MSKKLKQKIRIGKKKNSVDALNVLFLCVLFAARGEISEQRIDKNIATECEIARSFHLVISSREGRRRRRTTTPKFEKIRTGEEENGKKISRAPFQIPI